MIYCSENFSLDTNSYTLACTGVPQPIEPQVFDLLVYLIVNRDRVVTRDELLDKLWSGRIVTENALNGRLKIARRAVGDDGKQQRIIKTIQRRGYQFVAEVDTAEIEQHKRGTALSDATSTSEKPSIVVLCFANHSTQEGQEYFSEGISTNIKSCLSRIRALKVMSGFEFDCSGKSNLQIAQAFEADYLLSGSVQREDDRVRVFVELTDGRSGAIKWSQRFDRRGEKVMEIQDDLATSIVATLWGITGQIKTAANEHLGMKQTHNFNAFDCVLRAIFLKEQYSAKGAAEAHTWLDQALELDPQCAEAYAYDAMVALIEDYMGWTSDTGTVTKALADARRAVEIDSYCETGQMALGWAYIRGGDRERGFAAFDRAMEINPNSSDLMVFKGELMADAGLCDEGIELIQRGIRFNVQPPDWYYWHLGLALFGAARLDESIAAFERMDSQNTDTLAHLVACYSNAGRPDRAGERLAALMQEDPEFSPEQFADAHDLYSKEARALLLGGLEAAMGSGTTDRKLKIIRA
ncbi:MAG TPA: winged helix-turn-helix domain-containing protein [Gammaproteobacteria bacterium]|nr:winged helix-turn-helix domain-containing protein [Gammaproteobacteria bacterium]